MKLEPGQLIVHRRHKETMFEFKKMKEEIYIFKVLSDPIGLWEDATEHPFYLVTIEEHFDIIKDFNIIKMLKVLYTKSKF